MVCVAAADQQQIIPLTFTFKASSRSAFYPTELNLQNALSPTSLLIQAIIPHLGKRARERKGHSGNPNCKSVPLISPFFTPALSSPECHYPKNPSLTSPAGERGTNGALCTATWLNLNVRTHQPRSAPVRSSAQRGVDGGRGRNALTHFRQGCRKTSRNVQLRTGRALCTVFHDAMSPADRQHDSL